MCVCVCVCNSYKKVIFWLLKDAVLISQVVQPIWYLQYFACSHKCESWYGTTI